jgi:murein DD-endopeptidase MepM/ murein hydrolase activator NlpD
MSNRVAYIKRRAFRRLALAGLGLALLSGCSSDVTRFSQSGNPFSNPFSNQTAAAPTPAVSAAPTPAVATAPIGQPTTVAAAGHGPAQPVGGSAAGWTAVGGSPIVVAQGETLDTLSARYGVPSAALLKANGLLHASQVTAGARIIVPVYHADGHEVASAEPSKSKTKRAEDVADAGSPKAAKAKEREKKEAKTKEKEAKEKDAKDKEALVKTDKAAERTAPPASKDAQGPALAYAEPGKPSQSKKPAIDAAPTGHVEPGAPTTKVPLAGAQADAAGVEPEFRWPARGRIIQGFKAGGNDGINISVPAGTSVRAAESGVVVYAGDGLKGYGNLVLIKHPNGFVTAYGNNAELDVKRGEQVKRGQIIAKSGDTGNVNAPQLHFELRKGSTPVDPTNYLAGL